MLDVLVMQAAQADAVRRIEGSTALSDAHNVMHLDPSAAGFADALEPAAILIPCSHQLARPLPA
jgi:hypothetical protein